MNKEIVLSKLGHTWIIDLDGTIVKHNGYKIDGHDTWLDGAKEFLQSIPQKDMVIFLTSRDSKYANDIIQFLDENVIRYDHIIYNAPYGERILINDDKPSGLRTSISINIKRNRWKKMAIIEDDMK